jgi:hypothetical protein
LRGWGYVVFHNAGAINSQINHNLINVIAQQAVNLINHRKEQPQKKNFSVFVPICGGKSFSFILAKKCKIKLVIE